MKIALIGTAPLSRDIAPYNDPEWTIWACSGANAGNALPRIDAFFELHALVDMTAHENQGSAMPFYGWLRTQSFPVYMQEKNALVPQAIVFPRDEMLAKFGRNWFTSTVAWMMAFAINQMKTGDTIGIFGVDMAANMEHYTAQRAGCQRFIEIAEERGIKIVVPYESCLAAPTPLYGYSEATRLGRRLNATLNQLQRHRGDMIARRDKMSEEIAYFAGAIEQVQYMIRTWTDGADAKFEGHVETELDRIEATPFRGTVDPDDFEQTGALLVPRAKRNGHAKEA
jgi:hypothetical protein